MSTQLPLRDYQRAALDAVYDAWHGGTQRPAVVAPTGAGKTVMFSHLIREEHDTTGDRTVVLVHRDELADQAMDKIKQVAPHLSVGKVKAADNNVHADVVVASVQTLAREHRLTQLLESQHPVTTTSAPYPGAHGPFGLVIVDECHHAVAPSWLRVLEQLGCFAGIDKHTTFPVGPRTVGFSATLARSDKVGLGSVWQKVAYAISLTRLIRKGHLTDVRGKRITMASLDLDGVKRSGGDYQAGALGEALSEANVGEVVAQAYAEYAADRQGVVFTPTVETAHDVMAALSVAGFPTGVVTGSTHRDDRQWLYRQYQDGKIQVLVNCMVLTEGFDAPWASCAVIARPTQSAPLYTQMVGRVLRPWPGKTDALVLDVVGASDDLKLATLIDLTAGKVRQLADGESLAEAVEAAELEELETQALRDAYAAQSRMDARDVDLFAQSRNVWLRTQAGVWFIPTRSGEFFLWPGEEPGMWDVAQAPIKEGTHTRLAWQRLHTGLSLELAMSWAQAEAEEADYSVAARDASWRTKGGKASEGQQKMLARFPELLDGRNPAELRKGEASDLISIGIASRQIDRHYRRL